MTTQCPECKAENPDTKQFCGDCGTQLTPTEKTPVPTQTIEAPREELTTGSTFAGRYQIIEELGRGGMGRVYKATDTKINEKVALKLIKPEIASDKRTLERFGNELRIARKITHKNVGKMFDINEEEGTHYITMEYVSGQDLKGFIRQSGQMGVGTSISIAKQVCEGLSEAHKTGVIHRDLKPSNIMIDREGNVRIMDFGIARSLKEKGITGAGVMIGTPEYMSPEQAEAKDVNQRSDIYSLGVILYEMVTGRVPFEGDTALSIAMKHKGEIPKAPKEYNAQIPDDLGKLILKCLEKDKESRFQSAGEVQLELENIEKGIPTTDRTIPRRKPLTSKEITVKFNVKRVLIPTSILLAITIVAILIWHFLLPTTSSMNSLAVLPFEDLSPGKDQDYMAEGIPETLINALSRIEGLRVPGRTSSFSLKGEQDIQKIGQKLGVDALLEGSIHTSGNNLRIMVRLIKVDDGFQIWSEDYKRTIDDVFAIQDDIAQSIVKALKVKFLGEKEERIIKTSTVNNEAYNYYLQGLYYFRRSSETNYYRAIELFQKAIQEDQSFAQAYVGQAMAFTRLSLWACKPHLDLPIKAENAVKEALKLDESLAEAHSAYGMVLAYFRWDWEKAEQEFRRGLQLNPGSASVLGDYSGYLSFLGRYEEASTYIEKALEIDPLSLRVAALKGGNMASFGRYNEALEYFLNVLEMNPDSIVLNWRLAKAYIKTGAFEKAIQTYHKMFKLMEGENISDELGMLAFTCARWGKKKEAEKYLEQLISYSEQNYVAPITFAWVYGAMGNLDEAFNWLEQAYNQHSFRDYGPHSIHYDPIRNDPRFVELMRKIGLEK